MSDQRHNFIVLGATGSIGSALSRRLVKAGHRVLLAGRNVETREALASELGSPHQAVDAASSSSIDKAFRTATETFGRVDGVANCIGSVLLKSAHITTEDEWHDTLRVNLDSAFFTARAAAKAMRKQGGSVVLVSSAAARAGLPNHEAIAAAKAA